jgi:hypothetical protein
MLAKYILNSALASHAGSTSPQYLTERVIIVALFWHSSVLRIMRGRDIRGNIVVSLARVLASSLILNATFPFNVLAQANPLATAVAQPAAGQSLNAEQLDALLAVPLALYPNDLLTRVLMASAFPLEVVTAARWWSRPISRCHAMPWRRPSKSNHGMRV